MRHVVYLAIVVCLLGCSNEDAFIPDRPVYLERNILTYKLTTRGSYLYIDSPQLSKDRIGFGGVLIYLDFFGNYRAVDLACTNERDPNIRIGPPNGNLICTCETCGEQYDLSNSHPNPLKGIAKGVLRSYRVNLDEAHNLIYVRN